MHWMDALDWLAKVALVLGSIAAIIGALAVIAKSRVGGVIRFVAAALIGRPLLSLFRSGVKATVTPQIDEVKGLVAALDEKNDRQHSENAQKIAELIIKSDERHQQNTHHISVLERLVTHVRESLVEHRVEINDHLGSISRTLDEHFGEARTRDERITKLEGLAKIRIEVEPTSTTGETPVIEVKHEGRKE